MIGDPWVLAPAMKNYTLVALMEPLIQVSIVLTAVIRDGQGMSLQMNFQICLSE
jgi:hypothetical protein